MDISKIGGTLALFGIISAVLTFTSFELRLLMWIDNWGPTTGWAIRIGLIVLGVAIYFLTGKTPVEQEE